MELAFVVERISMASTPLPLLLPAVGAYFEPEIQAWRGIFYPLALASAVFSATDALDCGFALHSPSLRTSMMTATEPQQGQI